MRGEEERANSFATLTLPKIFFESKSVVVKALYNSIYSLDAVPPMIPLRVNF